MKKLTGLLAAIFLFTATSALAQDNIGIYGDFVSKTLIPQKGLCDIQKSYSGHEAENINDYFSGLISAFTFDFDGDGSDELVTVESDLISVYGVDGAQVNSRGEISQNFITDEGESYANVFAAPPYIGFEVFSENGSAKKYSLKIFGLDSVDKAPETVVKIEKTLSDDGVSEFASGIVGGEVISYSHVQDGNFESTVNKSGYADMNAAAVDIMTKLGFENPQFITGANRLNLFLAEADGNYRTNRYLPELPMETYVRATNIRLGGVPVVLFEDYSNLDGLSAAVTVIIDDNTVVFPDALPITADGRTLVPMRQIFEDLGCDIEWIGKENRVIATRGDERISLVIDSNLMEVNGSVKEIDVPAQVKKGRTYVPVRAISEAFGYDVDWDGESRMVTIKTN